MATKRKSISKSLRFEIFKRDGFTCQYCGSHPPKIILHVDHIHPVSKGGLNDMDNLITSCAPCNLGKSAKELNDVPISLKEKADSTKEMEAKIIGYQKIFNDKRLRLEAEATKVCDVYEAFNSQYTLTESAMISVKKFIEKIGLYETIEAMEIACTARHVNTRKTFKYFCGICWRKVGEQ